MERKARDIPELLRELAGWKARADGGLPLTVPVVTLFRAFSVARTRWAARLDALAELLTP